MHERIGVWLNYLLGAAGVVNVVGSLAPGAQARLGDRTIPVITLVMFRPLLPFTFNARQYVKGGCRICLRFFPVALLCRMASGTPLVEVCFHEHTQISRPRQWNPPCPSIDQAYCWSSRSSFGMAPKTLELDMDIMPVSASPRCTVDNLTCISYNVTTRPRTSQQ
jgi:hypothetical protein